MGWFGISSFSSDLVGYIAMPLKKALIKMVEPGSSARRREHQAQLRRIREEGEELRATLARLMEENARREERELADRRERGLAGMLTREEMDDHVLEERRLFRERLMPAATLQRRLEEEEAVIVEGGMRRRLGSFGSPLAVRRIEEEVYNSQEPQYENMTEGQLRSQESEVGTPVGERSGAEWLLVVATVLLCLLTLFIDVGFLIWRYVS